ncbi:hypothetical protein FAZ19_05955 [Sphingobacterium alkalisoli]|uniref:Outer membrane protein beta-barrel domain-containing protein n=1 Tax=Sphingobacterium alkalisoli TaxID=1874115 RepID=A0A4U0H465_9SPHI|nr:hypothetical protein [Sphingobacterium alkalisoli]TJY66465.1 hypothetical protein FAZ19_05955 [Sphingobacterium alkalisoli]GGH16248.1 hypothetical protein GCM10011418_18480 [Sphingobacterium alkalisoli]
MKKITLALVLTTWFFVSYGQDHKWAFGFYGDVHLEDPNYARSFGVQGKYDFANRHAVQAQVYGRSGLVALGGDYLFSFFDKTTNNFNLFLGAGIGEEFYIDSDNIFDTDEPTTLQPRENLFIGNGQVGLSYYFPAVGLSLYSGYKAKFTFEDESYSPSYVMLGIRYHLW